MRELITLVVLTTNQTLEEIKLHVDASLNVGLTPTQIKEAVYQCAPYIGFSKIQNSINQVNEAFKERNISLPVESQKQTSEENRYEEGLKVQKFIFGDMIDRMQESMPDNQKHIQSYLSAYCFGDI
jgi:4-carboxymuconolactone decarboxylase